ncbi:MAG: 23S rRNA (cytosine(1962)-C(5))-methyltransferase RlmI [Anaerolineales bacterium]
MTTSLPQIYLKPGREKSLLNRHPWVFSGAVAHLEGEPAAGDTVLVCDVHRTPLALAAYSPLSRIRARVWTWNPEESITPAFLRTRLQAAMQLRNTLRLHEDTDAQRLVHGESDGLPGLVVDRYADTLVMQVLSAGVYRWRDTLADILMELSGAARLYERSDVEVCRLEGLPESTGLRRGQPLNAPVAIVEHGLRFQVDVAGGHKTGFYLDQRANRALARSLAQGRDVLDCFSYTGGFTVSALAGGAASVLTVDSSAPALEMVQRHVRLNALPETNLTLWQEDVFHALRKLRDQARTFDLIILDPPKFAPTAAQAQKAARGYKDINLLGLKLLRPGGLLATFSCSGGVDAALFQKIVAGAAQDAGVDARILARLHQDADHPVAMNFPEGAYLKGLLIYRA